MNETGWEADDAITITVTTDAGDVTILDTTGSDIDNLGIEGVFIPGTANIPDAATTAQLVVTLDSNSSAESLYIDNIVVAGDEIATIPIVTIAATDADASETGPDSGTFTVSRTGDTTDPLTVTYTVGGTAAGNDFTPTPALSGTVTIASGAADATITITPAEDSDVEGDETVIVTLTDTADYDLGATTEATVTIADNDVAAVSVLNSLVFNEVLPDPNSSGSNNFDTDGDGTAETADEFVEVYNTSSDSLDISGLQFWDSGSDNYFTVPDNTTLGANGFIVVVANIVDGTLPSVDAGSLAFSANGDLSLSNSVDNLVLYDPATDEYIQAVYNGDTIDTPETMPNGDYDGFSSTATRIGSVQTFGNDTDGVSLALSPDGDTANPVQHNTIGDGSVLATPGAANEVAVSTPPSVTIAATDADAAEDLLDPGPSPSAVRVIRPMR